MSKSKRSSCVRKRERRRAKTAFKLQNPEIYVEYSLTVASYAKNELGIDHAEFLSYDFLLSQLTNAGYLVNEVYLKQYCEYLSTVRNQGNRRHLHHILEKSMFECYKFEKKNLIPLNPLHHRKAHIIFSKAVPEEFRMKGAVQLLKAKYKTSAERRKARR